MAETNGLLNGKVALITGGAQGFGAVISRLFNAQGATVIVTDTVAAEGNQLEQELGNNVSYFYLNVTDEAGWKIVIDGIMEDHGGLDILVNNTGSRRHASLENTCLEDTSLKDYMSIIEEYQVGTFLGMRSVLPLMKRRSDTTIINIFPSDDIADTHATSAYASSKWAIRGLSRTASRELSQHGIRVNSVLTRADAALLPNNRIPDSSEPNLLKTPLQPACDSTEVAKAVLFLASELGSHKTESEYLPDEGLHLDED